MSRHHPYAGYDESNGSGFGGGGHRKNGRPATRGGFGSSGPWTSRRGGGYGSQRGNWESEVGPDRGFNDFGEFGQGIHAAPRGGGGGSKNGKTRGLRGKGKSHMSSDVDLQSHSFKCLSEMLPVYCAA
ncbi:hypothetical protein CROQUDRAFT_205512 [Cronartium quercuum f. sp. fusiforme G11]|uniref:Uncharacterized protein n=1 Tax=Cronartium quercuum f. sp. fusiforme G11 TaxID=708437 RepID=A0A9P6NCD9_9BASI|nr:hypothetical protein CROQUDRAFT_205512 [Cronartium quercuum f. sp. fusiforme G11]